MSDRDGYIEAAMVKCPRCSASTGTKCWAWKCKHGRKGCSFAICAYKGELPEPHLERAVEARKARLRESNAKGVWVDTRDEQTYDLIRDAISGCGWDSSPAEAARAVLTALEES